MSVAYRSARISAEGSRPVKFHDPFTLRSFGFTGDDSLRERSAADKMRGVGHKRASAPPLSSLGNWSTELYLGASTGSAPSPVPSAMTNSPITVLPSEV